MATIDVKNLYLTIPHAEGIEAVITNLHTKNPDADKIPFTSDFTRELLEAILKHNIFEFNSNIYRQKQGTAMGTRMAPAYANLFMDQLETAFLEQQHLKPTIWKRFIDDIFCVWPHTRTELDRFLEELNLHHPTIKFTWEVSQEAVTFLDLDIYKGPQFEATAKLDTKLHFKSTNKFQYLHFKSAHPRSVFRSVARGEYTRALRATTSIAEFQKTIAKISRHLHQRGYPQKLTRDLTPDYSSRQKVLWKTTNKNSDIPPVFVTNFCPQVSHRELKTALEPPSEEITQAPLICYRRSKNLANTLVRARLTTTTKPPRKTFKVALKTTISWRTNSSPCGKELCRCCAAMSRKQNVFSTDNKTSRKTPRNTSCSSHTLIYLIECRKCNGRAKYVGQTDRTLRERMSGHRAAYLNKKPMPLYRHFYKPGHNFDDATITVLELLNDPEDLLLKEEEWMNTLKTIIPRGLNSKFKAGSTLTNTITKTSLTPHLN